MAARPDPVAVLRVALEALDRYRLRTALSVAGVVLGVAAVIAMLSIGEGGARQALAEVEALGLDNLVVRSIGGLDAAGLLRPGLTAADATRIGLLVPGIDSVSPLVVREGAASHEGHVTRATVLGVSASYASMQHGRLARGRFLSPSDEQSLARTCVLGSSLSRALFGDRDAIGAQVRILDDYYRVVGVLAEPGTAGRPAGSLAWRDVHGAALVPLATLTGQPLDLAPTQGVQEVWIRLRDGSQAATIGRILERALARTHVRGGLVVVVPRELLAQRQRTQRTFAIVLGSVAVLALLIGGIGVMNNMLTAVAERTPEIGLRRMAGATRGHVTAQFLVEAVLMTVGGGVLGIALGIGSSYVITRQAGWPTHVSSLAVAAGFGVSVLVGIVFGLYPAMRAAALQPVDAIRYE